MTAGFVRIIGCGGGPTLDMFNLFFNMHHILYTSFLKDGMIDGHELGPISFAHKIHTYTQKNTKTEPHTIL